MKKRGYQNRFILFYKRIGFQNFSFFPFGFYFPWSFGLGFTPSNLFFLTFLFRFGFAPFHLPPSVLFSFLVFFFYLLTCLNSTEKKQERPLLTSYILYEFRQAPKHQISYLNTFI